MEVFTRLSYILLESYSLSTLASLVRLDFYLPLNPGPSTLPPRASTHSGPMPCVSSANCSMPTTHCLLFRGLKTFVVIYFSDAPRTTWLLMLQHPTHAAFLQSFAYRKTQLHIVFEIHELTRPVKGQYAMNKICCSQRKKENSDKLC